jgi:hypothetical protein
MQHNVILLQTYPPEQKMLALYKKALCLDPNHVLVPDQKVGLEVALGPEVVITKPSTSQEESLPVAVSV